MINDQVIPDIQTEINSIPEFAKNPESHVIMNGGRYLREKVSSLDKRDSPTVYLAWDTKLKMLVTIKHYGEDSIIDPTFNNLSREAKLTDASRSSHAQRVFDIFEEDGKEYLVTYAYVEQIKDEEGNLVYRSQDLFRVLRDPDSFPLPERIEIINKLAHVLDSLWKDGKVHWDLKPENIIYKDGEIFLIDFGAALKTDEHAGDNRTQYYGSPEREKATRILPGESLLKSEIFSFGLLAFELVFGEHILEVYHDNLVNVQATYLVASLLEEYSKNENSEQLFKEVEKILDFPKYKYSKIELVKELKRIVSEYKSGGESESLIRSLDLALDTYGNRGMNSEEARNFYDANDDYKTDHDMAKFIQHLESILSNHSAEDGFKRELRDLLERYTESQNPEHLLKDSQEIYKKYSHPSWFTLDVEREIAELDLNSQKKSTEYFNRIVSDSEFNERQKVLLKELFMKVFAKYPEDRPASFGSVAAGLNNIVTETAAKV